MVFSSAIFLFFFLPITWVLYQICPGRRTKNALLIAASLVFYAFGRPVYVLLMLGSVVLNYLCGRLAGAGHAKAGARCAVVLNLALLGVFKYADFALSNVNAAFGLSLPLPGIVLPIGISFFTFQGLSYVLDVARGTVQASRSFSKVLLYISFFPQLIAGPIVKYHDIEQQIDARRVTLAGTAAGLQRFLLGLSKKLLLADTVGAVADRMFALPSADLAAPAAWLGAVCYTLQIYFDFSGYSDMAIGLARLFGFSLQENFDHPYIAQSIRGFWRRWHISLSSWFRDYLYIPLGGNRGGAAQTARNRFLVFFATGLWHGANWTFVLWGLWHGLFAVLEQRSRLLQKLTKTWFGHVYTLLVVLVGFVLFRSESLTQAGQMLGAMMTGFAPTAESMAAVSAVLTPAFLVVLAVAIVACLPQGARVARRLPEPLRYGGTLVLFGLCLMSLAASTFHPFIYFQF